MSLNCTFPLSFTPSPGSIVPAWADPLALMMACAVRFTRVPIDPSNVTVLAPADPKRVCIGFTGEGSGNLYIGPLANPQHGGWQLPIPTTTDVLWFTLLQHGPLVNLEWNSQGSSQHTIYVWEVYRIN